VVRGAGQKPPEFSQGAFERGKWLEDFRRQGPYDFIAANAPFGELAKSHPPILSIMQTVLNCLNPEGFALIPVEPMLAYGDKSSLLREILFGENCSIAAFLYGPDTFWAPLTLIRSPFLLIKKGATSQEFVAVVESPERATPLVDKMFTVHDSGSRLTEGVWFPPATFRGLRKYELSREWDAIQSDYKEFHLASLINLAVEVNAAKTGESYLHKENALYIPAIGDLTVVTDLGETTKKHQNYFQIVLNKEVALAEYISSYLNSKLGQLGLQDITSTAVISRINKSSLLEMTLPVPDLKTQQEITKTIQKLSNITSLIKGLKENISINPVSAREGNDKIDQILSVIGALADSDKIRNWVRSGESKTIEFKETLSLAASKPTKEGHLELSVIKTIAAFLNSDGGVLLIGINNDGAVSGIDFEIEKFHQGSRDKFLLHFKNLIKEKIGAEFYPFIDQRLVTIDAKNVLLVECHPSDIEVFVDGKDFYVRTNPATDKLEGQKLVEYVRHHFKRQQSPHMIPSPRWAD
jgi:hypothetical protein